MKKLFVIGLMITTLLPLVASAEKVFKPLNKSTMMPIGGRDATDEAQVLNVNPDGSINVVFGLAPGSAVHTGIVNIPLAGPADRVQMPDLSAAACTIQAFSNNNGSVYVGDDAVTNKDGVKRGLELAPGMPYNDVSIVNLNLLYVATDNINNKVAYLCN